MINISCLTYKRKILILLLLILILGLTNFAFYFFDAARVNNRASLYIWLEERLLYYADRIEITGSRGQTILNRVNNVWVINAVLPDGSIINLPVRQQRVEDFLRTLTRRSNYPVRSTAATPELLGIGPGSSRITIRGGAGLPLLDMLLGAVDASGSEIFLYGTGQRVIRSGEDIFTLYTESPPSFWYNLKIFPDIRADMVQRIHFMPVIHGESPLTFSRRNNIWIVENDENAGMIFANGELWLRSVLEMNGDDFVILHNISGGHEIDGFIALELGDGSLRVLSVSLPDTEGNRIATIAGTAFSYLLSEWTVRRIWSSSLLPGEFPED